MSFVLVFISCGYESAIYAPYAPDPEPVETELSCGDGIVEYGEACDDGNTYTETSEDIKYGDWTRACNDSCTAEEIIIGPYCGDGEINGPETCDENTVECSSLKNSLSGTTKCGYSCEKYDLSTCKYEGVLLETINVFGELTPFNCEDSIGVINSIRINGVTYEISGTILTPYLWEYSGPGRTYYRTSIKGERLTTVKLKVSLGPACILGIGTAGIYIPPDVLRSIKIRNITRANRHVMKKVRKLWPGILICNGGS